MKAPRRALAFLALAAQIALAGQAGPAPRPVAPTGVITDPGFAGALANSVQGTLNTRPGRYYGAPYLGGFAAWGGFYPNYVAPPPQPPAFIEQVNAPAVVFQPPAAIETPVPAAPTVSVYSYPARTQTADTQTPVTPEVAQQNAAALRAFSQYNSGTNAAGAGDYSESAQSANDALVLIALTDRNIVTAIAYWTDRNELKYVTPARQQKHVPISQVDVRLSERLNNERHVPFHLEASPKYEAAPPY